MGANLFAKRPGQALDYLAEGTDAFPDKSGPTGSRRFRNCGSEFIREEAGTGAECLAD